MEKNAQKCHAISVRFKNLSKVNYHPMGEKSPDLVTLIGRAASTKRNGIKF
jgi:hypothetical protein